MTGQINQLAALAAVNELHRAAARHRVEIGTPVPERPRHRRTFAARLRFAPRAA